MRERDAAGTGGAAQVDMNGSLMLVVHKLMETKRLTRMQLAQQAQSTGELQRRFDSLMQANADLQTRISAGATSVSSAAPQHNAPTLDAAQSEEAVDLD